MTEQLQAGKKKKGGNRKRRCTRNKRVLCAKDETPWETKEATSEIAGGVVGCVCVCDHKTLQELTYWSWCLHSTLITLRKHLKYKGFWVVFFF